MHKPTDEQQRIIDCARDTTDNIMVDAFAGCAKTSTLEMLAAALPAKPALAVAFNVKTKKEMEKRLPKHFKVQTLNGLGHSAWGRALGKPLTLDDKKLGKLITALAKEQGVELVDDQWNDVRQLVTHAMHHGLVPSVFPQRSLVVDEPTSWLEIAEAKWIVPSAGLAALSRDVLIASIRQALVGTISFDDQIFMSSMFNGIFPRFDLVLVDEAQDLSVLNHIQVRKAAAGRLIVVGDPCQSIYNFRGADSDSMHKMRALRPTWTDLPLTTTFRCPHTIVERQRHHAPGFTAWTGCLPGTSHDWTKDITQAWDWPRVEELLPPSGSAAILCRNNAPLLSIAFKLLRNGVPVVMLGRDIGKSLVSLSRKLLPLDETPAGECEKLIIEWMEHEKDLAEVNGQEHKFAGITDRGECLLAVLGSGCTNAKSLRKALDDLFSRDTGTVTLGTGHRAKGLEWDLVIHLDPWRLPSKFARKAAEQGDGSQMKQEKNLRYVIETRTRNIDIRANLEDFT